jgi:hypothetical protein
MQADEAAQNHAALKSAIFNRRRTTSHDSKTDSNWDGHPWTTADAKPRESVSDSPFPDECGYWHSLSNESRMRYPAGPTDAVGPLHFPVCRPSARRLRRD